MGIIILLFVTTIIVACLRKKKSSRIQDVGQQDGEARGQRIDGVDDDEFEGDFEDQEEEDPHTLKAEDYDIYIPLCPPEKDNLKEKLKEEVCSICLDKVINGSKIRKIKFCPHYFHSECIQDWVKVNETCPNCKLELSKKNMVKMQLAADEKQRALKVEIKDPKKNSKLPENPKKRSRRERQSNLPVQDPQLMSFHEAEREDDEQMQINRPRRVENRNEVIQNIEENTLQRNRRGAEFEENVDEVLRSTENVQITNLRQNNRQNRINAGRTVLESTQHNQASVQGITQFNSSQNQRSGAEVRTRRARADALDQLQQGQ